MKKRILSLVLCAAMLLSMCLFLGAGVTNSLTVCDSSGEAVKRVDLPVNQKISLTAQAQSAAENDAYQWQIRAAKNVWANILGSDTQTLELSYPMVASALSEKNTVQIRCRLTSAETGEATFSDAVTVEVTAATAVDTPASADAAAAPVLRSPAKVAAAANDVPEYGTYTIIIVYQFEDGRTAANPWNATVANGTTYKQDVTSPTVVGYAPDQPVVHVDSSVATTYTVNYRPAEVNFTVEHYQQNVDNDDYKLVNTETKKGITENLVGANLATTYEGFYSLLYDTSTKIAADGSTVVKVYYDRYYYLMNFDLDGGYGVEPIYARYGATINVGNPTKPGYSFDKWEPTLPATMPAENTTHKATWNAGTTSYTVVYWYENANDNGYSYVADQKIDAAPGISVSSDTYKDASFNNKDAKHFTYNASKAETVTVAGDGSTILNVYFTRNIYTLTFKEGGAKVLSCGKVEHEHTPELCCNSKHSIMGHHTGYGFGGTCNAKKCPVGYEHTHSDSCYKASDLTITAKYQADIHKNFPIKDGDETIWWIVPDGTETYGELDEQTYLGSIDTMPGENITFKKKDAESGAKIYYYVETLNGTSGDTTYNGKNYTQYKVIDLDYSSSTSLTYKEEFHPITGFTQGDSNPTLPKDGSVRMQQNNYLYYTRNSYKLKFYNYNADVAGKGGSVQYEAPLNSYEFEPAYPANLEENAYEFAGWYTTAGCYTGSEVNWGTAKMPASNVTLYAKWVPITHTVKTYKTENDLNGGTALDTWEVSHGTAVPEKDRPSPPENGEYTFVGWFYKDANGTEHAFDFSMPVNRDLNLYAKWIANTLVSYTIHYQLEDGTTIADDTTGSALALTTKTFEAKTGDQLNKDYQSGYFPKTSSHSIIMDIDDTLKNVYTFVYVPKQEVEYTVKYLEKGTGTQLADPKTVTTRDAVVTETFKQISGYAPDAYQKRLVLAAENNEIIFWYVKDDTHAPVQIIHWTQNIAGDGYTEYQSSTNLNGEIGQTYSEASLTIAGFTYNANPDHPVVGYPAKASGKLTASGLVLNLYYDRIEYPYEFRFLEQGTNKQLVKPATGTARYQAQVTQQAETIPGYTRVSAENQAINIAIENPDNVANKNVKIFYYTEQTVDIKYQVVGPDGSGTLDNYQEAQLKVLTGTATGSAPTAAEGYKFVGWYTDSECKHQVESSCVDNTNKLTPQKNASGQFEAATYYAKFERDVFELTIKKTGEKIDQHQTFVFRVRGNNNDVDMQVVITGPNKQVIKNLPVGDYTITEDTSWSWKYTPVGGAEKTLMTSDIEKGAATVTFVNENKGTNWLTSLAKALNVWKDNGTTVTRDPKN